MNSIKSILGSFNSRKRKSGISNGIAAAAIVIIIGFASVSIVAIYGLGGGGNTASSSTVSSSASTNLSERGTETSESSSQSNSISSEQGGTQGILSILISDPPHLPDNVSALFVTYSDISVHTAGLAEGDGWVQVSQSVSIQLLDAINVGQTIASSNVPSQVYDMISFNVNSAIVTYNDVNYTSYVDDGSLVTPFAESVTVHSSQASVLVVDFSPFVYNFGTTSNPSFVLKPTAVSFPAPSNAVTQQMQNVGNRYQFQASNAWFWQFRNSYNQNIKIVNANPSSGSFTAAIGNTGNQSVTIRAIAITPIEQQASTGGSKQGRGQGPGNGANSSTTPNGLSGSAVFLILPNGTLDQLSKAAYGSGPTNLSSIIWGGSGYKLPTGGSISLSYNGAIELGLRLPRNTQPGTIISGQQYEISVLGDQACASYIVTAS